MPVRDFSALCPHIRPHPWRSVRRRQRRMHEFRRFTALYNYPSRDIAAINAEDRYEGMSHPVTRSHSSSCLVDHALQTDSAPQLSYSTASTQTLPPPLYTDVSTQTASSPSRSSVEVQPSADTLSSHLTPVKDQDELYRANPVPSDDIWRSSPSQYHWRDGDYLDLLDPPLPPIPPMPRPPREYVTFHVDENWGHQVNTRKPPAPPPPRASYSLAETTADVLSFVSKHYPSILHAQFDYFRLPPYQRRAILDLHRLLFPYGLRKWRSASLFGLLPLRLIRHYFDTWDEVMSQVAEDSGAEVDYKIIGGVLVR